MSRKSEGGDGGVTDAPLKKHEKTPQHLPHNFFEPPSESVYIVAQFINKNNCIQCQHSQ